MPPARDTTWGIGCWQTSRLEDLVAMVETAERCGFDHLWYGNEKLHPDMWVGLTAAALRSRRLQVGSFVADPYSLHPAAAAAAIATIDAYSGGRAILLLGAGGSGLREFGIERRRPVATLEAAVGVIRALLRGDHVSYSGDVFAVDAALHFSARPNLPIWLAARAPRVLELAGRVADGAMVGTIARHDALRAALDRVDRGSKSAGRAPGDVRKSVRVDVSVGEDARAARDVLRGFVAGILSASYPDRSFVTSSGLEVPEELEAICRTKDLELAWRSGALVPDTFVDALTWAGTADDVASAVAAALDCGVDDVTVMFHTGGGRLTSQLEQFAADVIPRVAAYREEPVALGGER